MKSTKQILFNTISIIIMMLIFSVSLFAQNTNDTTATAENDTTVHKGKQKKYQALLWEITGNGLSKPSYLYGSMHVSKKVAFHLGDTFFMALRNVDVVALESNPGEWMDKYSTSEYYQKDQKTYNKYASSYSYRSFYQTAFQIDLPEKDDFSYLLGRSYDVMNSMLYRKYDYSADFEETTYLDLFIYQAGKKLGKQVVSLEDFEEARKLVDKASKRPKKKEKKAKTKADRDYYKNRYSYGKQLEDAYRRGDLDFIDSLSRLMDPWDHYHTYMIVKRNEAMTNTMDSVMQTRQTIFGACGAAHLPGDSGVIEMLRMKGYTLKPITRPIIKSREKKKEKIDKIVVKNTFNNYKAEDGSFSVDVPEKLYSNQLFSGFGEYLYPDMINGAYYVINRFSTYAPLFGYNPDDIKLRIDSLLYEYIPGEIMKRNEIQLNGFDAYEIVNKTSKGNFQHYNIIFTPIEIIVAKVSGNKKYVKRRDVAKNFFGSLELHIKDQNKWAQLNAETYGFSINMPEYRLMDTLQYYNRNTIDLTIQAYDFTDKGFYMLTRSSLHDFSYIEEDTFELSFMADQFAEQFSYSMVDKQFVEHQQYPAIDFHLKHDKKDQHIYCRMVIQGAHYYLLTQKPADSIRNAAWFETFSLLPVKYNEAYEIFNDTIMHFSVKTPVERPEDDDDDGYYSYYSYMSDDDEEDTSHEREYKSTGFVHKSSGDYVKVSFTKEHKYDQERNLKNLWDRNIESLLNDSSLVIHEKIISDSGLVNTMSIKLTDTNSTRMIIVKLLQKHGAIYRLYALTDTITNGSAFIDTFFSSFSPANDTLIGWSIFADKGAMWLKDIVHEDSTIRAQARQSVFQVSIDSSHVPGLINIIANPDFKEHDLEFRTNLIQRLGYRKHDTIAAFLSSLYKQKLDSTKLQFTILKALATQKTTPAYKTIKELLNLDVPLTSDKYEISNIFNRLNDSLVLCEVLYPDLLTLTRYREYEDYVYELLANLVDSNFIDPAVYAQELDIIYRNANDEWKRQLGNEEENANKKQTKSYSSYYYSSSDNEINTKLLNYTNLLIPFYNKDKRIPSLFNKILKSRNENIRLATTLLLDKKGIAVHDSIWKSLAKNPGTRVNLYLACEENNILDRFDTTYLNQMDFSFSLLFGSKYDAKEDSVLFICKKTVQNIEGKGYVYFYKSKYENQDEWRLNYSGMQPLDTTEVKAKNLVNKLNAETIYIDDDMDELIDKELKKFRLIGRERANSLDFDNDYFQYLFF